MSFQVCGCQTNEFGYILFWNHIRYKIITSVLEGHITVSRLTLHVDRQYIACELLAYQKNQIDGKERIEMNPNIQKRDIVRLRRKRERKREDIE